MRSLRRWRLSVIRSSLLFTSNPAGHRSLCLLQRMMTTLTTSSKRCVFLSLVLSPLFLQIKPSTLISHDESFPVVRPPQFHREREA